MRRLVTEVRRISCAMSLQYKLNEFINTKIFSIQYFKSTVKMKTISHMNKNEFDNVYNHNSSLFTSPCDRNRINLKIYRYTEREVVYKIFVITSGNISLNMLFAQY